MNEYLPVTGQPRNPVGNAKVHILHAFTEGMELLMEAPKSNEILLVCIDANASMGTRSHTQDRVTFDSSIWSFRRGLRELCRS